MTPPSPDVTFLSVQDVLDIHRDTIDHEGGRAGVRDIGLIDSAVAMPRQAIGGAYLHPDLGAMAAAYQFHLTKNHGFIDGNKRVGLASAVVFLLANGVSDLPGEAAAESIAAQLAAGEVSKDELTAWCRRAITAE